jgi:ethanolamine utilization protein EutN
MFLARIDGTMTSTIKHETLEGARLLIGQRLEGSGAVSGEPLVLLDTLGASRGGVVLVSTDGDFQRKLRGNNCPARLTVVGLVDFVGGVAV